MPTQRLSLALAVAVSAVAVGSGVVIAADHNDTDTASVDETSADLGDLYAFHTDTRLTLILGFDGYQLRGEPITYDPDLLYTFHIDTNADNVSDTDIHARFGQDSAGEWGVQVMGIPGIDDAVVGPVEMNISQDGAEVYAGLRDDPFFIDLEGLGDTFATGDLSFDPARDFVAIKNTMALVVEFDHANLDGTEIQVWATSGRKS